MMKLLIPVLLALVGVGAGVGAGLALKSDAPELDNACGAPEAEHVTEVHAGPVALDHAYVKMNNQFVIPVVHEGRIKALVVMSLSLEVTAGNTEAVYEREPRLRDAFLRSMFDHANSGGFDGDFTSNGNMAHLRSGLVRVAREILGDIASDVLIIDIARQDS
jgi:hypothetical protein